MSALMKSFKLFQTLSKTNPILLQQAARNLAGWNKDYKPGKFPESEAEKAIAAKKYNLLPEEYKPYADDGLGYGDYPKFTAGLGAEAKDNYYPYDYPELKRNFNETLHAEIDLYGEDRYSQAEPARYKPYQYWTSFLGVMAGCLFVYYYLERMRMYRPVAEKQYPRNGPHYTFETE